MSTKLKHWREKLRNQKSSRKSRGRESGFTLIEILISSILISIVILVAWSGLISLMNMTAIAEAKSLRQAEVNQALDFVSQELRAAKNVNSNGIDEVGISVKGSGDVMNVADLLTSEGFDLNRLGNYGDLVLSLEIPAREEPPTVCPANGPNAGQAPPSPSEYDQVVYDVRKSPSDWLGPRTLMRYGRLPIDGSFNPCEAPIASDPLADALADETSLNDKTPINCPGVLTGGAGFYACKQDEQTQVYFQSAVVENSPQQVSSVVTPRVQSIQPKTVETVGCEDEHNLRTLETKQATLLWIQNNSGQSVRIYWLDHLGNRHWDINIGNGIFIPLHTYVTQPWVVTDWEDTCLAVFMPSEDSKENIAVIQ